MTQYRFRLALPYQDYLPYYQGQVKHIMVTCQQGRRVQFPAMHLRSFVSRAGVYGYFCLTTKNNKFVSLDKISN